jgi:hypothetical protein
MKTSMIRLAAALLFAVGAWLSWSEARLATRVADARQQMATLQFQVDDSLKPAASVSDYLPGETGSLSASIRRIRATVAYWVGGYEAVIEEGGQEVDADILLTAANAAFRASGRLAGAPQQEQVQRLDGVLQAYAAVLKASPRHADAAYNYEFVTRVRDEVASRLPGKTPDPMAAARAQGRAASSTRGGDLPAGNTIHGRPGGPPPEAKTEEFQVIAPMEYGDREAQPEATPGGKIQRKG